jgi:hypothetical protein
MAAKKKKSTRRRSMRGLGLGPDEHTQYALNEYMEALTQAKLAAYTGAPCGARVRHAVESYAGFSRVEAHLDSGGSLDKGPKQTMMDLKRNMLRVISSCGPSRRG